MGNVINKSSCYSIYRNKGVNFNSSKGDSYIKPFVFYIIEILSH